MFKKILVFVLLVILLLSSSHAFTRINATPSVPIDIDAHGTCQKVTNTHPLTLFVPVNTAAEWSAFRANSGSVASLASCTPETYSWVLDPSEDGTCSRLSCGVFELGLDCERDSDGMLVSEALCPFVKPGSVNFQGFPINPRGYDPCNIPPNHVFCEEGHCAPDGVFNC